MLVEVNRDGGKTVLKSNPNTGELVLETPFAQVGGGDLDWKQIFIFCHFQLRASRGESGEFNVMSKLGSVQYNTNSRAFMVKCEGRTSGLDAEGNLQEDW